MVGDAVGEAVGTAGVGGDVPTDRARLLAGWVGGEVVAEGAQVPGQVEVDHAGLHPSGGAVDIDLQDAVHPGEDDDDGGTKRYGATGQARAGATGHHRPSVGGGDAHDRLDLGGRHGVADRPRNAAGEHRGVMSVQGARRAVVAHAIGSEGRDQVAGEG